MGFSGCLRPGVRGQQLYSALTILFCSSSASQFQGSKSFTLSKSALASWLYHTRRQMFQMSHDLSACNNMTRHYCKPCDNVFRDSLLTGVTEARPTHKSQKHSHHSWVLLPGTPGGRGTLWPVAGVPSHWLGPDLSPHCSASLPEQRMIHAHARLKFRS